MFVSYDRDYRAGGTLSLQRSVQCRRFPQFFYLFFCFTVLSEIKKWNNKYLRKLKNHINALAVNLLDNSETRHKLKRYTVVTLPDRPE
jgi:hypothetical protein